MLHNKSRGALLRPHALAASLLLTFVSSAGAEGFKVGEDPVSVIMKWRPTTATPEVQDFVRESRPDERSMEYKPLRGERAERPKLRSKDSLKTMVNEMDAKAAAMRGRAGVTARAPSDKPAGSARQ